MKDLKVTIVQTKLFWENIPKNLEHFSEKLKAIRKNSTDLILLPEMFSTGFTMNAKNLAEKMNGSAMKWMQDAASAKNAVVCGSLIITEDQNYFNRLIWMSPDGTYKKYDKRHLFRMATENDIYKPGTEKIIVEIKDWRICPLVCYDLRFPVWSRNDALNKKYDLLIYVANWPEKRVYAWKQLLIARAIENQSYVIGLNRIGKDGNGFNHTGDSAAINFLGEKISKTKSSKESVETISLSWKKLKEYRESFPALLDGDEFEIKT
ncbi:MAG TPA: amidohydrolase [Bacteroidia bacterium]|nr:amidohydrolase [Bacteroidia bacterium]